MYDCITDESFEKKFHVSVVMDGITDGENMNRIISSDHTHNRYSTENIVLGLSH